MKATRTPKRYRLLRAPGHPLAGASGLLLLHRKILFDRIGPGWHPCYWCGDPVEWRTGGLSKGALVVDHIDHDKLNNDPANLAPSCNPCNAHRLCGEEWDPWVPGTPTGAVNRLHARCRKGHRLTPENVYTRRDTRTRQCLLCIQDRSRENYSSLTPEEREAGQARNRESIPCPVCGESRKRGGMREHIRAMHEGPTSADLQRSRREEALQQVLDSIRAIHADGGKVTRRRLAAEIPGFAGAQKVHGYRVLVEMACGDASFLLQNSGPKGPSRQRGAANSGTSDCVRRAEAAGIPVRRFTA